MRNGGSKTGVLIDIFLIDNYKKKKSPIIAGFANCLRGAPLTGLEILCSGFYASPALFSEGGFSGAA